VALEAAGAGAYTASVPLSRPGTYIVVGRDEMSGEAVGTTGAVLTAGEELRPTGSDLALLTRIAEFTGGKKRDTLAGIFADRAATRFSYKDATPPLLFLAAFGLLFAVAARRLAVPDGVIAFEQRLLARLRVRGPARRAAIVAGTPDATATMGSLLDAKDRGTRSREAPRAPSSFVEPSLGPSGAPSRVPAAAAPVVAAKGPVAAGPRARPAGPKAAASPGSPEARPLTAAEILLARRRGNKP
jgi:hypothetical protein